MSVIESMIKNAVEGLEDKKGEDIKIIDISEVSPISDYFVLASGSNRSQIQAMADNVDEMLGKNGGTLKQIEGYDAGNWVLLDFQDVIVHIFDKENRLFYDLERIWSDGKQIKQKIYKIRKNRTSFSLKYGF